MPHHPTRLIPLLLLAGTALPALAAPECVAPATLVFQCLTAKGKQIQVCDRGKTIDYSFGKPQAAPEIVVRAPRGEVSTFQWQGIGRYMTYALDIPNGNTVYSVTWSVDKMAPDQGPEAGVDVEVNEKHVASVKCARNGRIIQAIEGMDVKPRN